MADDVITFQRLVMIVWDNNSVAAAHEGMGDWGVGTSWAGRDDGKQAYNEWWKTYKNNSAVTTLDLKNERK